MNPRKALAAVLLICCAAGVSAFDATTAASEGALRQQLQDARWPADIVRVADRYLSEYPQGAAAPDAHAMLDQAKRSARALDRNVRLFRSDFRLAAATPVAKEDVIKAALADGEAALRVAHVIRDRDNGVPFDFNRYVGWLQFSSALGNGPASYELAVEYRKADLPALAAPYEMRAEELGFQAPTSLDNIRK
jgi:hypothetical protein